MPAAQQPPPAPDDYTVTIKEAAGELGISPDSVYRLVRHADPSTITRENLQGVPYLRTRQPTPRVILISRSSLDAHKHSTTCGEYWEARRDKKEQRLFEF